MYNSSEIDEYGFKRSENFDYQMYERFMSDYLKVLAKRQQKWEEFLSKNSDLTHIDSTLKRYIRKGIPSSKRCDVWMKISGAGKFQKQFPNRFRELIEEEPEKSLKDSIIIDLPRTFPDNSMFNTQKEQLYNILIAFAHSNKAIGYCQGLNYIAGLLLLVTKDEEKSFWLLKIIVEEHVPNYHTSKMENLLRDLAVFKELVIRRVPEVNRHIENLGIYFFYYPFNIYFCFGNLTSFVALTFCFISYLILRISLWLYLILTSVNLLQNLFCFKNDWKNGHVQEQHSRVKRFFVFLQIDY